MTYKGVIDNDVGGFIKMPYINATGHNKWLIATSNSATGMRRLFPCWDEPGIKAKFTIAIKHPEHYNVFSNTPSLRSSLTMTAFVTTPEIPTYRIAILLLDKNDYIHISPFQNLELWRRKSVEVQWNQILKLIKDVTVAVECIWRQPEESLMRNKYAIAGLTDDSVDKLQFELYR
ncbi:hypothetical protein P5V15_009962 [Pogonomyrmex californicus]